jgi:hypothetical protein
MGRTAGGVRAALWLLVVLAAGCGGGSGGGGNGGVPGTPTPFEVAPGATDSGIVDDDSHYVHPPTANAPAGLLFVFFPGTGGAPLHNTYIVATAAAQGYHAVGLAYVNDNSINLQICPGSGDPDCPELVRLEILDGTDRTPLVDVDRANSIENRLIKLLQYLDANHPGAGWGGFLDATGQPRWELMAFAGHSQGAGHAAMVGKLHAVHRVALFSGTEPAPWTLQPLATPADRYYGLVHELEDLYSGIVTSWSNLGLPGTPTRVDGDAPPYGGSHRLQTQVTPASTTAGGAPNYHGSVVVDVATPLDGGGTPLLRDAWVTMIGP